MKTEPAADPARLRAAIRALVRRFGVSERADVACCGVTVAQAAALEALGDRVPHRAVNGLRIREAHLPLGRVHVHVHLRRRDLEEEHRARKATARQHVAVHVDERMLEQAIAHGTAVHEEVDAGERRPVAIRPRREALDAQLAGGSSDRDEGQRLLLAEDRRHALEGVGDRRPGQRRAIVARRPATWSCMTAPTKCWSSIGTACWP